ncbi:hypothetical protein PVPAM_030022500 [Plasmodium vivax]|nr:hypothetical protein PVPAM_030022500 [Plasmodium vivax]
MRENCAKKLRGKCAKRGKDDAHHMEGKAYLRASPVGLLHIFTSPDSSNSSPPANGAQHGRQHGRQHARQHARQYVRLHLRQHARQHSCSEIPCSHGTTGGSAPSTHPHVDANE